MHQLIESFDTESIVGLRDSALIGVLAFTFARVEAVVGLRVKDFMAIGMRTAIRLQEKGGKEREIPCHQGGRYQRTPQHGGEGETNGSGDFGSTELVRQAVLNLCGVCAGDRNP
jgi:hypothetical protein